MTVFTKAETGEEKTEKTIPQVVVSPSPLAPTPSPTPTEEEHVGKKKRSSSFGPLSVIRLSPSPLARTPSPSPPEYDDHWARLYRVRGKLTFIALLIFTVAFVAGYFFRKAVIPQSTYQAYTETSYNDNGRTEHLKQNFSVDPINDYEEMRVQEFGNTRPAIFIHDFRKNLTAIVDMMAKRCFVKELDRSTLLTPKDLLSAMRKMKGGAPSSPVVRETLRVGMQLSHQDLLDLNSQAVNRHCLYRPVFMLHKVAMEPKLEEVTKSVRRKRDAPEDVFFAVMDGTNVEVDHIIF